MRPHRYRSRAVYAWTCKVLLLCVLGEHSYCTLYSVIETCSATYGWSTNSPLFLLKDYGSDTQVDWACIHNWQGQGLVCMGSGFTAKCPVPLVPVFTCARFLMHPDPNAPVFSCTRFLMHFFMRLQGGLRTVIGPLITAVVATNKFEKEMAAAFGGGAEPEVGFLHGPLHGPLHENSA